MKIGIVYKDGNRRAEELARQVEVYLKEKKIEAVDEKDLGRGVEYILSFGGDGTLIHKSCEHLDLESTFVGINTGRLGFLTAAEAVDWKKVVEAILDGGIFTSDRMVLEVNVSEKKFRGINEAAVKGLYRVVEVSVKVNGQEFLKVNGDGVIVATQTGSTAYSLSAGGPIIDPELDSFSVTPINPIGLPIPSAVMSAEDEIEVEVVSGEDVSLIIDGQEHTKISQGQSVKVRRGSERVKFGYLSDHHFIRALNLKFGLASRVVGK